ncbi:MAG: HlyD family type I secretion periplasmic adaptor subunit, partial [Alphaproteobacteria bacterium]|nr:HlyD family type I secretion periplasmic adaptor subunit [Alphaproteobacteria bacterium]
FAGTFGVWATQAPLTGALIAPGRFVIEGSSKRVQHQTGGVVSDIPVHDGQHVAAGDVVVRLDATAARANLAILTDQMEVDLLSRARLTAERDGKSDFAEPPAIEAGQPEPERLAHYHAELAYLASRLAQTRSQKEQLDERIVQFRSQIDGIERQIAAKRAELTMVQDRLSHQKSLLEKQLTTEVEVTGLSRDAARLEGEIGQLSASAADVSGKIAETGLQRLNIDQQAVAAAGHDLQDTNNRLAETTAKRMAALDQMARTEVRAPQSGTVHQLDIHTVGGVVSAGDTLMMIVPDHTALLIDAAVSPTDVEYVHTGDAARIRVSGLDRTSTPEIEGTVSLVGADRVEDPSTHASYYPLRVMVSPDQIARLGTGTVIPGMPAEVYVTTSHRTFYSYLVDPLLKRLSHAARER